MAEVPETGMIPVRRPRTLSVSRLREPCNTITPLAKIAAWASCCVVLGACAFKNGEIAVAEAESVVSDPDMVLGTKAGEYGLFTPEEVVEAGGGGGVPEPPATGKALLESTDGTPAWQSLDVALEEELYEELSGSAVPASGALLTVDSVDDTGRRVSLDSKSPRQVAVSGIAISGSADKVVAVNSTANNIVYNTPQFVVSEGLPSRTGNAGEVLTVNSGEGGFEWTAKQAIQYSLTASNVAATASPGTASAVSRGDHVHGGGGGSGGGPPLSDTAPVALGGTAKAGTANSASRQDHVHPETGLRRHAPRWSGAASGARN